MESGHYVRNRPTSLSLQRIHQPLLKTRNYSNHRISSSGDNSGGILWYLEIGIFIWKSSERGYHRGVCIRRWCSNSVGTLSTCPSSCLVKTSCSSLYWLGLYEDSTEKVFPLLFHVDFSPILFQGKFIEIVSIPATSDLNVSRRWCNGHDRHTRALSDWFGRIHRVQHGILRTDEADVQLPVVPSVFL